MMPHFSTLARLINHSSSMSPNESGLGSLAESAQQNKLKGAKSLMWLLGVASIAFQSFLFFNSGNEYQKALEEQVVLHGGSVAALEKLDAETKAEVEKERTSVVSKLHLIYGAGIGLGAIFIACALLVNKKPVIATVTALVLYLGANAAWAAIDPTALAQGVIVKIAVIVGLVGAVKVAVAYERGLRMRAA